jgi:hypothetical protein
MGYAELIRDGLPLDKPFSVQDLGRRVREVLGEGRASAARRGQ